MNAIPTGTGTTVPETDSLLAALAAAQRAGNPVPGDPGGWRRIIRIALQRWRTFPRRHPGVAADTLSCRTEDLARGLLHRCAPARDGARLDITEFRRLAAGLAAVLHTGGPVRTLMPVPMPTYENPDPDPDGDRAADRGRF